MSFATWIKLNLGILFVSLHHEILFKDNQTNIMIDLFSVESAKGPFFCWTAVFIFGE